MVISQNEYDLIECMSHYNNIGHVGDIIMDGDKVVMVELATTSYNRQRLFQLRQFLAIVDEKMANTEANVDE